jgi:prepilin-type processing-associated H-X9-DG protein
MNARLGTAFLDYPLQRPRGQFAQKVILAEKRDSDSDDSTFNKNSTPFFDNEAESKLSWRHGKKAPLLFGDGHVGYSEYPAIMLSKDILPD